MKTHDHLWTDPSADELVQRHNLANPIECECKCNTTSHPTNYLNHLNHHTANNNINQHQTRATTTDSNSADDQQSPFDHHHHSNSVNFDQQHNSYVNSEPALRKPLALSQSLKTTMVTDCHHFDCKHSNHRHNSKGYSFTSQDHAPIWSPKMLHETLHQNSKSLLLYAKNNVLMQTNDMQTMPGYLSLHQTSSDLIIKWIPNQMINGGNGSNISISSQQNRDHQQIDVASSVAGPSLALAASAKKQPDTTKIDIIKEDDTTTTITTSVSSNNNHVDNSSSELTTTATATVAAAAAAVAKNKQQQSQSVKSSYLDLVVNLSVSKIVYLHCHEREDTGEETIILVERDGTQRAPIIFPKGGLSSFLSCIESGLEPNSSQLDPPLSTRYANTCCSNATTTELSNSGDIANKVAQQDSLSDLLIAKLPLLGRGTKVKQAAGADFECKTSPQQDSSNNAGTNLEQTNSSSNQEHDSSNTRVVPSDYVFRIITPLDKYLQSTSSQSPSNNNNNNDTPPNSANSTNEDTHLVQSNNNNQHQTQQQQHNTSSSSRIRTWNLSRFTQFANISKYSTSSTNSTNSTTSLKSTSITSNTTGESLDSCWSPASITSAPVMLGCHNPTITVDNSITPTQCDNPVNQSPQSNNSQILKLSDNDSRSVRAADEAHPSCASTIINGGCDCDCTGCDNDQYTIDAATSDQQQQGDTTTAELIQTNQSIQTLCLAMRKQIISRAFYGWLSHCRHFRTVRLHLAKLVKKEIVSQDYPNDASAGLTKEIWLRMQTEDGSDSDLAKEMFRLVYYGGIKDASLRKTVWPYLLGHYQFEDNKERRDCKDNEVKELYYSSMSDWRQIEAVVRQRDRDICAANMAKYSEERNSLKQQNKDSVESACKREVTFEDYSSTMMEEANAKCDEVFREENEVPLNNNDDDIINQNDVDDNNNNEQKQTEQIDVDCETNDNKSGDDDDESQDVVAIEDKIEAVERRKLQGRLESTGSVGSDASLTDQFGCNVHRIDKDVQRCDRNYWYFTDTNNLDKLRNVMYSYVWHNLDVGYVQGMCDLAAPFLVIFDDEIMAYSCFSLLMKRMVANFPHGGAMDQHFASLRYMLQVLDPELFEMMQSNSDYTHFYFCYRWLLLDFKRELTYDDVFRVWEIIWAASHVSTDNFVLFVALAMIKYYRDIIIENNMDFTDTIKFFNEMAEKHDAQRIVSLAKDCVLEVQNMLNA